MEALKECGDTIIHHGLPKRRANPSFSHSTINTQRVFVFCFDFFFKRTDSVFVSDG